MKKNLLSVMILSIAAIPAFGAGVASYLNKENNPYYKGECKEITIEGKTYTIGNIHGKPSAPTRVSEEDVIRNPEGESQLYTKKSAGTALLGNEMVLYKDQFPAVTVWGENNKVYVKDILSTIPTDTYIMGELKDGIITFQAGQVIEYIQDDPYNYGIAIGLARTEYKASTIDFYYEPDITEFSIKVSDNGDMELILPGEPFNGKDVPEYALCLYYTDDLEFAGYSDFFQTYSPEDFVLVTMPSGVEPELYVYIDEYDYASFVNIAYTDDSIYIQGLNPMMPESVVRAKINGDTATIDQNEYTGIYMDMFYIFTKVLVDNPDYNEKEPGSIPYIYAPADEGFTLSFDREAGTITSSNKHRYLSFQPDEDSFENALCFLEEFILRVQKTSEGTPANPTHLAFYTDWVYYQGFADFQFNISNYSTMGTVLDVDHLYYQVIVNGKYIVFGEQALTNLFDETVTGYPGVPELQQWMPYLFSNDYDIFKYSYNEFDIGIYVPDVETIAVQTMYIYENKMTYSDIVTLDVESGEITETPDAVETIEAVPVKSVEYYTLSGMKVENPTNGIFVKRIIYSDGKIVNVKQLMP